MDINDAYFTLRSDGDYDISLKISAPIGYELTDEDRKNICNKIDEILVATDTVATDQLVETLKQLGPDKTKEVFNKLSESFKQQLDELNTASQAVESLLR